MRKFDQIEQAIAYTDHAHAEPLICWQDAERFAATDCDFHHVPQRLRPDRDAVSGWIRGIGLRPLCWWLTHGGGARLLYGPAGDLHASELAAVAGLAFRRASGGMAAVEVKTSTRHPAYKRGTDVCGPVTWEKQSTDMGAVAALLSGTATVDEAERDEWLAEHGHQLYGRAEHEHCPIDPAHPSERQPVWFGDEVIHCKSCQARGKCYQGCKRPGIVPWSLILPGTNRVESPLRRCVENFTHWEHARHVVRHCAGIEA